MRIPCVIFKIGIWGHYYHWSIFSSLKHNPLQESQILELCSSCNYKINMGLSYLVVDSDFIISFLSEVCNIDSPTLSACKPLCKFSVLFPNPSDYSEMSCTMTTAGSQLHQDVLFLNSKCCDQHYSCQAIPCPDVLSQLHNLQGAHIKVYTPPHYPTQAPNKSCPTLHSVGFNGLFSFSTVF